jgi:hypothetical protein
MDLHSALPTKLSCCCLITSNDLRCHRHSSFPQARLLGPKRRKLPTCDKILELMRSRCHKRSCWESICKHPTRSRYATVTGVTVTVVTVTGSGNFKPVARNSVVVLCQFYLDLKFKTVQLQVHYDLEVTLAKFIWKLFWGSESASLHGHRHGHDDPLTPGDGPDSESELRSRCQ